MRTARKLLEEHNKLIQEQKNNRPDFTKADLAKRATETLLQSTQLRQQIAGTVMKQSGYNSSSAFTPQAQLKTAAITALVTARVAQEMDKPNPNLQLIATMTKNPVQAAQAVVRQHQAQQAEKIQETEDTAAQNMNLTNQAQNNLSNAVNAAIGLELFDNALEEEFDVENAESMQQNQLTYKNSNSNDEEEEEDEEDEKEEDTEEDSVNELLKESDSKIEKMLSDLLKGAKHNVEGNALEKMISHTPQLKIT